MWEYEEVAAGERRARRYDFKRGAAAAAACESSLLWSVSGSELGDRRLRFNDGSGLTAAA